MKRYLIDFNFQKYNWSSWEQKSYQADTLCLPPSFQKAALIFAFQKFCTPMTKIEIVLDYAIKVSLTSVQN